MIMENEDLIEYIKFNAAYINSHFSNKYIAALDNSGIVPQLRIDQRGGFR